MSPTTDHPLSIARRRPVKTETPSGHRELCTKFTSSRNGAALKPIQERGSENSTRQSAPPEAESVGPGARRIVCLLVFLDYVCVVCQSEWHRSNLNRDPIVYFSFSFTREARSDRRRNARKLHFKTVNACERATKLGRDDHGTVVCRSNNWVASASVAW